MPDTGVIALDPVGLARLEGCLRGLDQGCRSRAAEVADGAALAGFGAPPAAADLLDVAAWCRRTADEVRWRRAVLEGMGSLPVPPMVFAGAADARDRARDLAGRLADALADRPPSRARLSALLAQVARGATSAEFLATLVDELGSGRIARLERLVDRLGLAEPGVGDPGAAAIPAEELAAAELTDPSLREQLLDEARSVAIDRLGADHPVSRAVADLTPESVERWGMAKDVVVNLVRAGRSLRRGPARLLGPASAVVVVPDVMAFAADPDDVHMLRMTSSVLAASAPFAGPLAPVAYLGAAFCAGLAWMVATATMSPGERDDYERRHNSGTGEVTYPSGSAHNPHVDAAGVPLDPAYVG